MTRFVPFETNYDQIKKLEKSAFILLIISAILIIASWAFKKFFDEEIINKYSYLIEISKVISYVSMIGFLVINLLTKILFHNIEKRKRNDLIDNSFGTTYSDENTSGYYNNQETENGIKKLALNSYESSFHTENTLKYMLYKNLIILVLMCIPFLLSIFTKGGSDIVRLLFEISIPITLFSQFVIVLIYYLNVSEINERFKIELTNIGVKKLKENHIPKLIIPIMEYYSIKSWANTNLDSKIFKKYNDQISEKWKQRKINLNK
jgi:hypothetical protein